jgi:excisionase family DNA binding protein
VEPERVEAEEAPRVHTVEEAAKEMRISRSAAFRAVQKGEIPSLRVGRRILVPAAALRKLLGED